MSLRRGTAEWGAGGRGNGERDRLLSIRANPQRPSSEVSIDLSAAVGWDATNSHVP